jgi:hypothetical protein
MSKNDLFTLGLKWIGVYCLVLAAGELFEMFPIAFIYASHLRKALPGFEFSHWLSAIGPIGFLTIGIYLMRGGTYIQNLVFHRNGQDMIGDSRSIVDVGIKLFGIFLIAASVPGCVWVCANVLIVLRAAPYLSVEDELERIRLYLVPVLSSTGLGICCVVWGSTLAGLAFRRP